MLLCGQSNRVWHYFSGAHPGSVGLLLSPSYFRRVPIDPWMPFALDNGAYVSFRDGKDWDECAWLDMLNAIKASRQSPLWAAVPDVVANRAATIERWKVHSDRISELGWPKAFCVQDGMTESDVPKNADVIFVGGSDRWKLPNLERWTKSFPRVHCARINHVDKIEACERLGCESVDGTSWFRAPSDTRDHCKLPAIKRFILGARNSTPTFNHLIGL